MHMDIVLEEARSINMIANIAGYKTPIRESCLQYIFIVAC